MPPVSLSPIPSIIYVERLTLAWLLEHFFIFINVPPNKNIKVFFIDHDRFALTLARGLALNCSVAFDELRFQCIEAMDHEGVSIRLKTAYQELAVMVELIRRCLPDVLQEDKRLALYLMKAPVTTLDLYSDGKYLLLRQAIILINFVQWHIDKTGSQQDAVQVHLFQRPFLKQLCAYAQSKNIKLCSMKPYRSWRSPWQKVNNIFSKLNGKVIQSLLWHFLSVGFNIKRSGQKNTQSNDAKLLVESRLAFNLSRQDHVSDLFLLGAQGGIRGEDVLLVFNGSFNPVDEDKFKAMHEAGIEAVALTPQSSLVSPSKVPVFSWNKAEMHLDMRWHFKGLSSDFDPFLAQYAHTRSYWESFFKCNNIKLWTTFYKNEPEHIAMSDALSAVGGVSTMYQRSYEPNASIVSAVSSDVVFSFSKAEYAIEIKNGSDFRYHIATGYLGEDRFGPLKPGAKQLRERLQQAGVKHIVAYFDESTIDDDRWFSGHSFVQKNYAFWLEKLFENSDLGLIFKPKVPKTLRRRLGEVSKLLTKAEKTGRCYVFEGGEPHSSFPPAAASLASDMVIQENFVPGTSGLEAALSGTRTILMDFDGWPSSPLYRLGPEVVFKDWGSAWESCREYFKDPLSRPRLGDWSDLIDELDPFHDGLAAHRMSTYLKELLEGLRRSEPPLEVMDRVAENYARRWGKDKVQRGPRK